MFSGLVVDDSCDPAPVGNNGEHPDEESVSGGTDKESEVSRLTAEKTRLETQLNTAVESEDYDMART